MAEDAAGAPGGGERNVLAAIGHTSIVGLRKVVPGNGARILAKLEWENPTGSLKDRMALAAISRAEADGRLRPGDTVVEYTGEHRRVQDQLRRVLIFCPSDRAVSFRAGESGPSAVRAWEPRGA